mgnify:FL=1
MNYKPLPDCCTVKTSVIEGLGMFAKEKIKKNTNLGLSHLEIDADLYRTPLGGFVNHSDNSNCIRVQIKNKWYLKTKKDINIGEELTLTYTLYNPK